MTLTLYLDQNGRTPLCAACFNGHDKVVQLLLDHGVQMDVQDKVSDKLVIHVKLCNTTEVNKATLVIQEINKNDSYVVSFFSYDFNCGISIQL